MSALAEIQREIDRMIALCEKEAGAPLAPAAKRYAKASHMQVRVGQSAAYSILAVTGDPKLPEAIDDVPLVMVHHIPGFEVVVL